jgi:hypothetical protein
MCPRAGAVLMARLVGRPSANSLLASLHTNGNDMSKRAPVHLMSNAFWGCGGQHGLGYGLGASLRQAAWQLKMYGLHQEASGWLDVEL